MFPPFSRTLLFPLLLTPHVFAASVELSVSGFGFDSMGNALTSTPTNGQNVYDDTGNLLGTWQVVTGNTFTATQDENNRNESSAINYGNTARSNTNNPDSHTASFASFDASADLADHIVIDRESLDISVSWTYRDLRWQRRDIIIDPDQTPPDYDLTWTITSFDNVDADLGVQTGDETLTSLGVNQSFGYTGYVDDTALGSNQVVPGVTFSGDTPESLLEYSGSTTGQLTQKYDGSDFTLTLDTTQSRDTNAIALWDDTDDGDGDGTPGETPRGQLRAYLDADYDYTLEYTSFTFLSIPEPSSSALLILGFSSLLMIRSKSPP